MRFELFELHSCIAIVLSFNAMESGEILSSIIWRKIYMCTVRVYIYIYIPIHYIYIVRQVSLVLSLVCVIRNIESLLARTKWIVYIDLLPLERRKDMKLRREWRAKAPIAMQRRRDRDRKKVRAVESNSSSLLFVAWILEKNANRKRSLESSFVGNNELRLATWSGWISLQFVRLALGVADTISRFLVLVFRYIPDTHWFQKRFMTIL